jgi:hypothetical protein
VVEEQGADNVRPSEFLIHGVTSSARLPRSSS